MIKSKPRQLPFSARFLFFFFYLALLNVDSADELNNQKYDRQSQR